MHHAEPGMPDLRQDGLTPADELRMLRRSTYRHHRLEGITAMAKVISTLFISADGVAEIDPDWHFPYFDENMGRAVGEDYDTADVLLIGRETYDSFAGAWPGSGRGRRPVRQATRRRAQGSRLAPAAGVLLAQLRAD
jgi:hypothetical protein